MAKWKRQRIEFERKVFVGFAAAAVVVATLTATTWRLTHDATGSAALVARTYEIVNTLAQTRADTLQIEFSTQSYRISGDPAMLAERSQKVEDRESSLLRLKQLLNDSPVQMERWDRLRVAINERVAISRQVVELRDARGLEAANAYVANAPLRKTRERTYAELGAMEAEARTALEQRLAQQIRTQRILAAAGTVEALLLLSMLSGTYWLIRRQLRDNEGGQRALAQSEASLATTLRSLSDAVLETDARGRITRMNLVAEHLSGWSASEALGRPCTDVLRAAGDQGEQGPGNLIAQTIASGAACEGQEQMALLQPDGAVCPIDAYASPIHENGELHGVVLVFRDVTVQRQAQRLIQRQKALLEESVESRTEELRQTQAHLSSILGSVPAMIAFVDADRRYVYVNEQYRARFSPHTPDLTGFQVQEVLGQERYAIASPLIAQVLLGRPQRYDWEPFPGIWETVSYVPHVDRDGEVSGYYVLGSDITERKLADDNVKALNAELGERVHELERVTRAWKTLSAGNSAMLRASEERQLLDAMCKAIVDAGGYPIATVWYGLDDEPRTLSAVAESGYPLGMKALEGLKASWADDELGQGAIATAIRTGTTRVVGNMLIDPAYEPWRPLLLGHASCIACPLRVGSTIVGALAIFAREPDSFGTDEARLLSDYAEDLAFGIASLRAAAARTQAEQEMRRLARYDALTGLPNETQFVEQVTLAIEQASVSEEPQMFAALQVNIERLSEINESLGFSHGDQLLREFAMRLRSAAPNPAHVARLRGDEFALLLQPGDEQMATAMADRLQALLKQPFAIADIFLDVSIRTGISLFAAHGTRASDVLRHMDIAVGQAKKQARSHVYFDPSMDSVRPDRLNMAGELRRAIENGDLRLHLQPKVDITTGQALGAEALVRWQHAERGLIPPGQFIELAERTGLIRNLTEWVIEAAVRVCREGERWGVSLPVAVNLSARNLRDEGLLERLRLLLRSWGIKPGMLEFEITESTLMEDAEFALRTLHGLREEGIPLYIDDFGTGYSSLAYLQKLPVDYLKIDRSFIREMSTDPDAAIIVKSTIDLAHDLGHRTVAEGIETRQDWDRLAELGCDVAQGYFVAKPMPVADYFAWARERQAASCAAVQAVEFH